MHRKLVGILVILASLLTYIQPVSASNMLQSTGVVGNGTPQSCTDAALRAALANAGTITFNCGSKPVTIYITGGEIILNGTKTIDGGGMVTLDAQNRSRIFRTPTFADFLIMNITLINGKSVPGADNRTYGQGGAIFVDVYSKLKAVNVNFVNNTALSNVYCFGGGAIKLFGFNYAEIVNSKFTGNRAMNGGAINNLTGDLVITNSLFDSNNANYDHSIIPSQPDCTGNGGAILVDGANTPKDGGSMIIRISNSIFRNNVAGENGGGLYSYLYYGENMNIDQSSFENNYSIYVQNADGSFRTDAGMGGGLYLGGDETSQMLFTGKYSITNSTINNNHADFTGGGISLHAATLQMSNVTVANNEAKNTFNFPSTSTMRGMGGGIAMFESSTVPTNTRFTNITVAGNSSGLTGGGILAILPSGQSSPKAAMGNSIVANNLSSGSPVDCQKTLVDLGGNVQYPAPTGFGLKCSSSVAISDPRLSSLANNGGATKTVALQSGSSAINHAVSSSCPPLDQRGYARNGTCDTGAYEYNGFASAVKLFVSMIRR